MDSWTRLDGDGEDYFPYYYQITNLPGSMIYRRDYGIRFDAYGGGWGQRTLRNGFEVNGDFEIEFKGRIVQGTGDAVWQKGGVFVGDVGEAPPKLWLSFENPIEPANARICRYIPGGNPEWKWDIDHHNFSQYEWQVVKAVRVGNTLTIYRNGNQVYTETAAYVSQINGTVGLMTEALSFEYEYLTVDGVKEDFTNLDNANTTNWLNLDQLTTTTPSTWTTTNEGLQVTAQNGWNHRAVMQPVSQNFTVEFKVKVSNPIGTNPKAGIMLGDLGDGVPNLILGLDHYDGGSSIVKYIPGRTGGEWHNFSTSGLDVTKWQTIRLKKVDNAIYIYLDGIRVYFEQGSYINNLQGNLGIIVEACTADFEFVSFKEE